MSSNGAEMHLNALKDSFKTAANSLAQFYKQSSQSYNVAYQQGKLDAYEEIFQWLSLGEESNEQNQDLKYVPMEKFKKFMTEKINKQESESHTA